MASSFRIKGRTATAAMDIYAVVAFTILLATTNFINVVVDGTEIRLLNAYNAPLEAMTTPGNFYFLEFPLSMTNRDPKFYDYNHEDEETGDGDEDTINEKELYMNLSPMCGNGSPYSFLFRRGSDEHLNKLLVEFEGGGIGQYTGCWNDALSTTSKENYDFDSYYYNNKVDVSWQAFAEKNPEAYVMLTYGYFPQLGSCGGVTTGFMDLGSDFIFHSSKQQTNPHINKNDVPIPLRPMHNGENSEFFHHHNHQNSTNSNNKNEKMNWWDTLGGKKKYGDIDDIENINEWSYLLVPHCTLDYHLGYQEKGQKRPYCDPVTGKSRERNVYHRGGINARAIEGWIKQNFGTYGLDALITVHGGQGSFEQKQQCSANHDGGDTNYGGNGVASMMMASNLIDDGMINSFSDDATGDSSSSSSSSSVLVVTEGSGMWNKPKVKEEDENDDNDRKRKRNLEGLYLMEEKEKDDERSQTNYDSAFYTEAEVLEYELDTYRGNEQSVIVEFGSDKYHAESIDDMIVRWNALDLLPYVKDEDEEEEQSEDTPDKYMVPSPFLQKMEELIANNSQENNNNNNNVFGNTNKNNNRNKIEYAWMASSEEDASEEELQWLNQQQGAFHVYQPSSQQQGLQVFGSESSSESTTTEACPVYTFPADLEGENDDVVDFFTDVVDKMSWSSSSSTAESTTETQALQATTTSSSSSKDDDGGNKLTFLSIFLILTLLICLSWMAYYGIKAYMYYNSKQPNFKPRWLMTPTELWFHALTNYPFTFYCLSLLLPIILSVFAFVNAGGLNINLNFDTYLEINTELENIKRAINVAATYQSDSLDIEKQACLRVQGFNVPQGMFNNNNRRDLLLHDEEEELDALDLFSLDGDDQHYHQHQVPTSQYTAPNHLHHYDDQQYDQHDHHRNLNLVEHQGDEWITMIYQNRKKGGNVFEKDVLESIHAFETAMMELPAVKACGKGPNCIAADSLISKFNFDSQGNLVSNIDQVLMSFAKNSMALSQLDQYFSYPDNLGSNVTKAYYRIGRGLAYEEFFQSFFEEFLWKEQGGKSYKAMTHTWDNEVLKKIEADSALKHDSLWSIASLLFVAVMIMLKVRSVFVAFSSMFGLVLAFSVSYYWVSGHFIVQDITLLWIAGLFVMLGIGADDIFLMVDSFDHTEHEFHLLEIEEEKACSNNNNMLIKAGNADDDDDDFTNEKDDDEEEKKKQKKEERARYHGVLRKRMEAAYRRAGSMMMVSSVTTAICFFSNAFGVLTVVQEFGIFMGMVVLINYIHVMTILPSSILVNNLYIIPFFENRRKQRNQKKKDCTDDDDNEEEESMNEKGSTASTKDQTTDISFLTSETMMGNNNNRDNQNQNQNENEKKSGILRRFGSCCSGQNNTNKEEEEDKESMNMSMNFFDRFLVLKYAPWMSSGNKRALCLIVAAVILSIILGVVGALNFAMTDGTIVLYSRQYNLGRLQKINDMYFNDKISKTIEVVRPKTEPPTAAPITAPPSGSVIRTPSPTIEVENWKYVNATINYDPLLQELMDALARGEEDVYLQDLPSYDKYYDENGQPKYLGDAPDYSSLSSQSGGDFQPPPPPIKYVDEENLIDGTSSSQNTAVDMGDATASSSKPPPRPTTPNRPAVPSTTTESTDPPVSSPESTTTESLTESESDSDNDNDGSSPESDNDNDNDNDGPSSSSSEQQQIPYDGPNSVSSSSTGGGGGYESGSGSYAGGSGSSPSSGSSSSNGGGGGSSGSSGSGSSSNKGSSSSSSSSSAGASSVPPPPPVIPSSAALPSGGANLQRRETVIVNLIWGVDALEQGSTLWTIKRDPDARSAFVIDTDEKPVSKFDVSEPVIQSWFMEVTEKARADPKLSIRDDKPTWIEMLRDFAVETGVGFPIPKPLFLGYVELLKARDRNFEKEVAYQLGSVLPGISGGTTFVAITLNVDAAAYQGEVSISEAVYTEWNAFAERMNVMTAELNEENPTLNVPTVTAHSRIFVDAYRAKATIDSTVTTWFVANGLCLLVILLFIQNIALSFMVMVTITLILLCLTGMLFAVFRIPFGPVEALGVSIFIGLSANYSLHVVHSYHYSSSFDQKKKIKDALYAVGSPIVASALSTMGACVFLFACRTWVFIELGVLICSITSMALLYTMTFLFSWLYLAGPRPIKSKNHAHLHRWDFVALFWIPLRRLCGKHDEYVEVGGTNEQQQQQQQHQKPPTNVINLPSNALVHRKDDNDDYSIEIIQDDDDDDNGEDVEAIQIIQDDNDDDDDNVLVMEIVPDISNDEAVGSEIAKGRDDDDDDDFLVVVDDDNDDEDESNKSKEINC